MAETQLVECSWKGNCDRGPEGKRWFMEIGKPHPTKPGVIVTPKMAQEAERMHVMRTHKRGGPQTGKPAPWLQRHTPQQPTPQNGKPLPASIAQDKSHRSKVQQLLQQFKQRPQMTAEQKKALTLATEHAGLYKCGYCMQGSPNKDQRQFVFFSQDELQKHQLEAHGGNPYENYKRYGTHVITGLSAAQLAEMRANQANGKSDSKALVPAKKRHYQHKSTLSAKGNRIGRPPKEQQQLITLDISEIQPDTQGENHEHEQREQQREFEGHVAYLFGALKQHIIEYTTSHDLPFSPVAGEVALLLTADTTGQKLGSKAYRLPHLRSYPATRNTAR